MLHGINLTIPAGEHLAILGPSGAGKSTLASLILRMIDPVTGSVRVGGEDLRDLKIASVRSHVSILLQDSVLFGTSVRDNIRFGRLDATDHEIEEAAALAQADGFIRALPDGYDTVLGEAAKDLSGGQRQRIAIARAILRRAPIVILDEATAGPGRRIPGFRPAGPRRPDPRPDLHHHHPRRPLRPFLRPHRLARRRQDRGEGRPEELLQGPRVQVRPLDR